MWRVCILIVPLTIAKARHCRQYHRTMCELIVNFKIRHTVLILCTYATNLWLERCDNLGKVVKLSPTNNSGVIDIKDGTRLDACILGSGKPFV